MSKVTFSLWALGLLLLFAPQSGFACDPSTQSDASGGHCDNSDCFISCPSVAGGGGIGGNLSHQLVPFPVPRKPHAKDFTVSTTQQPSWSVVMLDTSSEGANSLEKRQGYLDVQRGIA
jgi:hypothetical protein